MRIVEKQTINTYVYYRKSTPPSNLLMMALSDLRNFSVNSFLSIHFKTDFSRDAQNKFFLSKLAPETCIGR